MMASVVFTVCGATIELAYFVGRFIHIFLK